MNERQANVEALNKDREQTERARINAETAKIGWHELQRFFAQGNVVSVSPQLDLVEVAYQASSDNKSQIERWMTEGVVGPVSDAQAIEWLEARALMWSVVVRPWVLVQPVLQENADNPQESKQMLLSEQQLNDFQKYGYTVVPSFYSAEEVDLISAWLDGLRDSDGTENDVATYFETSPSSGETVLVRAEHLLGDHSPEITDMMLKADAMQALSEVLGDTPLLFKEKANYKLPGCRSDMLHQDQAAGWGKYGDFFVTMMIAVDENRVDNAAISFRRAEGHKLELIGPEWEVLSEDDPPFQPEEDYKVIEAQPGDIVLFDCYVPHGSPANLTDRPRRNVYLTFNRKSDGDHRMAYYHDKWESYPPNTRDEARDRSTFRV